MISPNLIKKFGILGVSMGLMISPLALSDEVALPAVIVIGEDMISPSFRSNPVNDPRDITQAAFRGPVTANGFATADLSPSFRSNPVNDSRYITQAAFRGPVTASGLATEDLSPSFQSNPANDPLMNGYDY
ncbi:hypothetical protein MKP05_15530 [Halomonas sp. EGI 63088]|uniref:Uncharacterized protein n=1 Tax=Halomonas flagellata TaxID=2920385 RepID=A0ABS9RXD8_9GAMM|nr:hypothetical protein [Halomonas flagellata]MCH4564515.1 hypothetical protein [Halomonas flagellata]